MVKKNVYMARTKAIILQKKFKKISQGVSRTSPSNEIMRINDMSKHPILRICGGDLYVKWK